MYIFFACAVPSLLCGLSLVAPNGSYSVVVVCGFLTAVAPLVAELELQARGLQQLCHEGHSCSSWALEHRLNSCGTKGQWLHGMWDLPRSEVKPMSLSLAGRLFIIEPSGRPLKCCFKKNQSKLIHLMRSDFKKKKRIKHAHNTREIKTEILF